MQGAWLSERGSELVGGCERCESERCGFFVYCEACRHYKSRIQDWSLGWFWVEWAWRESGVPFVFFSYLEQPSPVSSLFLLLFIINLNVLISAVSDKNWTFLCLCHWANQVSNVSFCIKLNFANIVSLRQTWIEIIFEICTDVSNRLQLIA
jgi:hypothetical protein